MRIQNRRKLVSFPTGCTSLKIGFVLGIVLLPLLVLFDFFQQFATWNSTATAGTMHDVELYAYGLLKDWDDFLPDSNLKILADNQLASRHEVVSIEEAHTRGLLHRGIWIALMNPQNEILLLRRADFLKTCPGEWGLVGEHSDVQEAWIDTARRALIEELRIKSSKIINLMPNNESILVHTSYSDRSELQATGIFAAFVDEHQIIQPDKEVAELRWASVLELQKLHACNDAITDLAHFVAQRLIELGLTAP